MFQRVRRQPKYLIAWLVASLALLLIASTAQASVDPAVVNGTLHPGGSMDVAKQVTTPEIPPVVDVCLLEDETGSFGDDIANLQGGTTASDLYDAIVAASPGANFAVAGFRDYPISPYGSPGDWVYRLLSSMDPAKANWLAGIAALTAGGGNDTPEAQYDAIVRAARGADNCGWRDPAATPGVQRVLVVTTDAPFHNPDGTHINSQASTIAALNSQGIIVIGLKAPGAGFELDVLAGATGGSVQPLGSDGANIAQAILDGLGELTTDVWWEITSADAGLNVSLTPDVHLDVPGNTTVPFAETISVDADQALCGQVLTAVVTFIANSYPEEGSPIGREVIEITVECEEIDIKPNSDPSSFGCNSNGMIPVALLSTATFDATTIDPSTVLFGETGTEAAEIHTDKDGNAVGHPEDVNGDGLMDVVFHFSFGDTGFDCDDIPAGEKSVTLIGVLTGTTTGGDPVFAIGDITLR